MAEGILDTVFQHTAARRRLAPPAGRDRKWQKFQHTAARRRLAINDCLAVLTGDVSTHSRPKAAGFVNCSNPPLLFCFNTQPPEGGWVCNQTAIYCKLCFNTQPPEGGWHL